MEDDEGGEEAFNEAFRKLNWSWKTPRCDEEKARYFDATFVDHHDIFFAHLNEIDPNIAEDYIEGNDTEEPEFTYIDPRNGRVAEIPEISMNELFRPPWMFNRFPTKSSLTAGEHAICIKALNNYDRTEEIIQKYANLKAKIEEERKKFNEFVKNHFLTNNMHRKKEIPPHLFELFASKWKREVEYLKENRLDFMTHNYTLATAIPLKFVRLEKISIKIVTKMPPKQSAKTLFCHDIIKRRVKGAAFHLEKYYENLIIDTQIEPVPENYDVSLPITSLLYLMQGYYDESNDWMLPITISDDGLRTQIQVDHHLPVTKLGSICRNSNIALDVVRACFVLNGTKCSDPEEERTVNDKELDENSYKVKEFEKFIEDFNKKVALNDKNEGNSKVLHSIEMSCNGNSLSLMVSCLPDVILDGKIVIFSPKLEYQPEFGEEQMTQYELIREWVHLKFMNNVIIKRIRFHYATYWILSVRDITLKMVTAELFRLYQIQEEDLVTSLFQLISMLKGFPPATYLGKHDPSKKEKILIYQQKQEMQENPSNLNLQKIFDEIIFQSNPLDELEWTPIDPEGLADIHIKAKIAPGLLPHYGKFFRQIKDIKRIPKVNKKMELLNKKKKNKSKLRKKKNKKIKEAEKNVNSTEEHESFDPLELFDESGHINFMSILPPKSRTENIEEKTPEKTPQKRILNTPSSSSGKKRIVQESPSVAQKTLETTPKNNKSDEKDNSQTSQEMTPPEKGGPSSTRTLRNRTISVSENKK